MLEAPLGFGMFVAGATALVVGLSALGQGWFWIELLLAGLLLCVFGVLAVIHAFTGSLPDWIVGTDDDDPSTPDSPAA